MKGGGDPDRAVERTVDKRGVRHRSERRGAECDRREREEHENHVGDSACAARVQRVAHDRLEAR